MNAPVVLVVDDSLLIRAVLRQHLEEQGYLVIEAPDGNDAVRLAREAAPDVVLLDVEMPGLDGHGVLAAMQQIPSLRDIPVVFLTGHSGTEDLVRGLEGGAFDYLRKPFEPAELVARMRAAVRVKTLQDELRRRNVELDFLSRTDSLTGLFNRRHLEEQLTELCSASRRHRFPVAVLLIDLDHLKRVNDTEGHAAGDAVLRAVAALFRDAVRREDIPGRWGGEELMIAAPFIDTEGAMALGERLRRIIGDRPIAVGDGRSVSVTVSVGLAAETGSEMEALVRAADMALYAAKAAGRNTVRGADQA